MKVFVCTVLILAAVLVALLWIILCQASDREDRRSGYSVPFPDLSEKGYTVDLDNIYTARTETSGHSTRDGWMCPATSPA